MRDYKKKLAEKETIQTILMAKFEGYTRFRSPHTSHIDFLHQRLAFPFLLPTPHVVDKPPEFLVASIERVAPRSEAGGQLSSSPHQKEEKRAAERSSSNSCAVVVPQQRRDPPLNVWLDLAGNLLLSAVSLPLPVFCAPLPPIFSTPPLSPLCRLGARGVPSLPAIEAKFPPQYVVLPTQPHKTRHRSQKG